MTDRTLRPTQQFSVDAIRRVEREILDTFLNLALGVSNDVRFVNQPLDDNTRKARILNSVDEHLNAVYGSTRETTTQSPLFRIITGGTDEVGEKTLLNAVDEVKRLVDAQDQDLWERLVRTVSSRTNDSPIDWLLKMHSGDEAARERVLRSGLLDPNRRWVAEDGYRLSDRLWNQKRKARRDIDDLIARAIAEGKDPLELAEELERYLNPYSRSYITMLADGREIVRNSTYAPGRGGLGNFAARRLAVTEIQRVNAAAALHAAKTTPGIQGVQWVLSNSHVIIDDCDDHAEGSSPGMPPGVYLPDEAPLIPDHPFCRCVYAYHFDESNDWIDDLIDGVMEDAA